MPVIKKEERIRQKAAELAMSGEYASWFGVRRALISEGFEPDKQFSVVMQEAITAQCKKARSRR